MYTIQASDFVTSMPAELRNEVSQQISKHISIQKHTDNKTKGSLNSNIKVYNMVFVLLICNIFNRPIEIEFTILYLN